MAKVIFSIQYEVFPAKREEYLGIIRELKTLVSANGLIRYSVFEKKNKQNNFVESYEFENEQAYEEFDDNQNERVDILMSKLSDMIKENSTKYITMYEVLE